VAGETPPPDEQEGTDNRTPQSDAPTEPPLDEGTTPGAPEPGATAEEPQAEAGGEAAEPAADAPAEEQPAAEAAGSAAGDAPAAAEADEEDDEPATPREKPAIPGMDLEVDIVMEGEDKSGMSPYGDEEDLAEAADEQLAAADEETVDEPIAAVQIDLKAGARYTATGKRKTAIARVILTPGNGAYTINGKTLDEFFPRPTLQRNIRQPLETVGYEERMDVIARMQGGGVSAQAGALRHGISRALLEADPNLRGELKRRGFLTRDARAKERKKAGLKKARKRPQFSKR
jgi:small subunit ribosomal protein S9